MVPVIAAFMAMFVFVTLIVEVSLIEATPGDIVFVNTYVLAIH